jgi:hypothetical protein
MEQGISSKADSMLAVQESVFSDETEVSIGLPYSQKPAVVHILSQLKPVDLYK